MARRGFSTKQAVERASANTALGAPDDSGRRRPDPVEGSEEVIEEDNEIAAIGQFPDLAFLDEDEAAAQLKRTRWNSLLTDDQTMLTNLPGVFAAGDGVLGAATVVEAIGAGRRAARSIHLYLSEEDLSAPDDWIQDRSSVLTRDDIPGAPPAAPRAKMPELAVPDRSGRFVEVELGLPQESAVAEARRCLQCGLLCYRKSDPWANDPAGQAPEEN